jgi:hypothetical protein
MYNNLKFTGRGMLMKKLIVIMSIMALIVLSSFTNALATTQNSLSVSPGKVKPGDTVSVIGDGFLPGASVSVAFDGNGVKSISADSSGGIAFSHTLPGDLSQGVHSFSAEGTSNSKASSEPYSGYDKHVAIGSVKMESESTVQGEEVKPTPSTTVPTAVLAEKTTPTETKSSRTELPFTGGLPLYLGIGAGMLLAAAGYKLRK